MDAQAIKRIEELTAATFTRLDTDVPAVLAPSGAEIRSLEELLSTPLQMKQTFRTERLEDFIGYVEAEEQENQTAVFVDPNGAGAEAVIDYGSHAEPLWGRHRARLAMRYTPEFAALLDVCGRRLSQREAIEYLEDWMRIVSPFRGNENMPVAKALGALRRVDIKATKSASHEEADWSASRSSMEEIEAKSGAEAMPDGFFFTAKLYPCTGDRTVAVRMSLLTGDEKPAIRFRIMGREALMQDVAEEIEDEIRDRLPGSRVYVGAI